MKTTIKKLAFTLGLPEEVIEEAYMNYWRFIKAKIEEMPLKDDLTEEEYSKLRTSISVPYLGKFNCTYKNYLKRKENYKKLLENVKHKKDKTNG